MQLKLLLRSIAAEFGAKNNWNLFFGKFKGVCFGLFDICITKKENFETVVLKVKEERRLEEPVLF